MKNDGFEVIAIKGNNEELLVKAWEGDEEALKEWQKKGGEETLKSFGANSPDEIPEEYKEKIKKMGYYLEMDEAYIVHAGFNFQLKDPFEDKDAMLNIRNYKPDEKFLNGKKIIHGHTPITLEEVKQQILDNSPAINIDAGCVFFEKEGKGHLAAIELGSWKLYETRNLDAVVHQ